MARKSGPNNSDLDSLRGYRRQTLTKLLPWLGLGLVLILLFYASSLSFDAARLERSKQTLINSDGAWGQQLVTTYEKQRAWLARHGIKKEVRVYDSIAARVLGTRGGLKPPNERNLAESISASFSAGFLRAVFIVIAAWRLWLFALIAAFAWKFFKLKPHGGRDLLGQTGNGRLFYSGIGVGLKERSADGTPSKAVVGLACPKKASEKTLKASHLHRVLRRWNATNETTKELAAVILAHDSWPAFVVAKEDLSRLNKIYHDHGLIEHAGLILDQALMLAKKYSEDDDFGVEFSDDPKPKDSAYDPADYAQNVGHVMHRVLTPTLRNSLKDIRPHVVAACVLAYEAGKCLAYGYEGGAWRIKSNFPQLSARAVLHSIPSFGEEFELEERQIIRRALIYGARRSSFGPVRFPIDLSLPSQALRQWIEVCMAVPFELAETADEVELFGLVRQGYRRWVEEFYQDISGDLSQDIFATKTSILFVPVSRLVRQAAKALNIRTIGRIDSLIVKLSERQRAYEQKVASTAESEGLEAIPVYDRIMPPLTKDDIAELAKMHETSAKDLRIWSSVRMVLNAYGWLSRRVGDYSVPEHSIIFSVLRTGPDAPEANEHGLVGKGAMVPLRGYKLEYKFGRAWQTQFPLAFSATMAESKDVFDKLMLGQSKDEVLGHTETVSV